MVAHLQVAVRPFIVTNNIKIFCKTMAVASRRARRAVAPPAKKSPLKNTRNQNTYLKVWGFRYGVVWLPLKNHHLDQARTWNGFRKWHFRASKFQKHFWGSMPSDTTGDSRLRRSFRLPPHTQISSYGHEDNTRSTSQKFSRVTLLFQSITICQPAASRYSFSLFFHF